MKTHGVLALLLGCFTFAAAGDERAAKWKITGKLEEACSCNAACPCWFGWKPTKPTCSGAEVLFIERGTYRKVKLDGLAIANYAQSPEDHTMMESFGNWNFSTNYIDERADPGQRKALEAIAEVILPSAHASTNFKTHYVPITREVEGKEHIISIGNIATFSGQMLEGGLGGNSRITNPPGADPVHRQYTQGKTSKMVYNDSGQNWDWTDSNYMSGTFTTDSDEYARYTAGLTRKMGTEKRAQQP